MILQAVYPMVVAIPLIGLIIWLVVGLGLRPINWLAKEFRQREANDLSQIENNKMPDELQQLTQSANELLRRLEASFDREKRFSSDAAHELRTPIAALKIHCENLLQESVRPSESLLKLQQGIDRMSYLVEQILSLNRMSPDHFMGTFSRLNVTELLKNQVAEQSRALAERQHSIEFDGDECWIYGDRLALETLISNLLSNAIKYTPAGGRIAVGTWLRGEEVVLEIMDNGPGIDESAAERVFDRFYRLGGDRNNSAVQGCGLGLSIVRQVVDLHRARIKLTRSRFATGLLAMVIFPVNNVLDANTADNDKKGLDENV
jgi:two-component system sensor histidine kinase QseC